MLIVGENTVLHGNIHGNARRTSQFGRHGDWRDANYPKGPELFWLLVAR